MQGEEKAKAVAAGADLPPDSYAEAVKARKEALETIGKTRKLRKVAEAAAAEKVVEVRVGLVVAGAAPVRWLRPVF